MLRKITFSFVAFVVDGKIAAEAEELPHGTLSLWVKVLYVAEEFSICSRLSLSCGLVSKATVSGC